MFPDQEFEILHSLSSHGCSERVRSKIQIHLRRHLVLKSFRWCDRNSLGQRMENRVSSMANPFSLVAAKTLLPLELDDWNYTA